MLSRDQSRKQEKSPQFPHAMSILQNDTDMSRERAYCAAFPGCGFTMTSSLLLKTLSPKPQIFVKQKCGPCTALKGTEPPLSAVINRKFPSGYKRTKISLIRNTIVSIHVARDISFHFIFTTLTSV